MHLCEWGFDIRATVAAMAQGISARARQLGIEQDLPHDQDLWR